MNAGKIKAVLFVIVTLLIVAMVLAWVTDGDSAIGGNKQPAEEENKNEVITVPLAPDATPYVSTTTPIPATQAPAPVYTPTPTVPPATPVPTTAPTTAPTVEPTPAPTPEPTPTVTSGTVIASGSFSSETGTKLDIRADWQAVTTDGGKATVTVKVYVLSYSLTLRESTAGLNFSLGSQYKSTGTPAVELTSNDRHETLLGSQSFTVDASGAVSLPLAVEWQFIGSYGGVELDALECGGTVSFG